MTDIEQVSDWALSIAAEAAGSKLHHYERMSDDNRLAQSIEAHARAIEQHEAFKLEVSDVCEGLLACTNVNKRYGASLVLNRFIIPKTDPLVEALNDMKDGRAGPTTESYAACLRAALAARGLEVRKIGEGE